MCHLVGFVNDVLNGCMSLIASNLFSRYLIQTPETLKENDEQVLKSNTRQFLNPLFVFCFQARFAAGGLRVTAANQHGASGALKALTAPALQRACFSTSRLLVIFSMECTHPHQLLKDRFDFLLFLCHTTPSSTVLTRQRKQTNWMTRQQHGSKRMNELHNNNCRSRNSNITVIGVYKWWAALVFNYRVCCCPDVVLTRFV